MSRESADPSESGSSASLVMLSGALVLLVVGGFLSGGIVVSFFERGAVDLVSAIVMFLLGIGMVSLALLVLRRQE